MAANKMRFYRITQGLLLKSIAYTTGLSEGHLSRLENGDKQPSKAAMESIAKALNRTVQEVFYDDYTNDDKTLLAKCGYQLTDDGFIVKAVKEGG